MMDRNFLNTCFILSILLLRCVQKMSDLLLRKVSIFTQVA